MNGGERLRSRVRLAGGREFDLIRAFLPEGGRAAPGVRVGPGDDCAVLDAGPLALSTDLSVEDVHFRRAWLSAEEVGWRAAAAALSDLAAVAAEPVAVLVSLALADADAASGWGERLMRGVREVTETLGASLVGGDLARSPGPAVIDVVVAGRAERPVLRDGGRPGDEVWVTGRLGGAAAAVRALLAGEAPAEGLRTAFARPCPRVAEARWLAVRAPLHALIDLSDGLAGDAAHVAAASALAVELETHRLPVAPGAEARDALEGGEDYELCLLAPAGALEALAQEFLERFGVPLTRVGRARAGEGVWLLDGAGGRRPAAPAFRHFQARP